MESLLGVISLWMHFTQFPVDIVKSVLLKKQHLLHFSPQLLPFAPAVHKPFSTPSSPSSIPASQTSFKSGMKQLVQF